LLPTYDVFDEARYFEPAASRHVFAHPLGKIGFAICEDFWWEAPDASEKYTIDPVKELMDEGSDILVVPSASPFVAGKLETRLRLAQKAVRSGGIPVVYCNAVGANDSLVFDGRSFVMAENGSIGGMCGWDEEVILYDTARHQRLAPSEISATTSAVAPTAPDMPNFSFQPMVDFHVDRYEEIAQAIIVAFGITSENQAFPMCALAFRAVSIQRLLQCLRRRPLVASM